MYMYMHIIAIIGKRSCELGKGQRWVYGGGLEREKEERNDVYFIPISTIKEKMLMPNLRKFYNLTPENVMGLKLQPPKRYLYTT